MSKSGQKSLRLVIGAFDMFDMGGAPSSIPIASSYKKTAFQMSNKNAGFFQYWHGGVSLIPKLVSLPDPATT